MNTLPNTDRRWDIDTIVSELRLLQNKSLESRQREGRPLKLPSCKACLP